MEVYLKLSNPINLTGDLEILKVEGDETINTITGEVVGKGQDQGRFLDYKNSTEVKNYISEAVGIDIEEAGLAEVVDKHNVFLLKKYLIILKSIFFANRKLKFSEYPL